MAGKQYGAYIPATMMKYIIKENNDNNECNVFVSDGLFEIC